MRENARVEQRPVPPSRGPVTTPVATPMQQPEKTRVVIVDDSPPVRWRLRDLIEDAGVARIVGEGASNAEAIMLCREHTPDAVVLDLQLLDGDCKRALREIGRILPACAVIILTNYNFPEWRDELLALGARHFFDKLREFERVPEVLAALAEHPANQDRRKKGLP